MDVTGDEARSDAVKSNINSLQRSMNQGSDQTGDGKGERRHSRNQRTTMDWNG